MSEDQNSSEKQTPINDAQSSLSLFARKRRRKCSEGAGLNLVTQPSYMPPVYRCAARTIGSLVVFTYELLKSMHGVKYRSHI